MADIVKMNTYLVAEVDQDDLPKMRAVRDRYINKDKAAGEHACRSSRGWRGRAG